MLQSAVLLGHEFCDCNLLQHLKKERNPGPRSFYLPHQPRQLEGKDDVQADAGGEDSWSNDAEQ